MNLFDLPKIKNPEMAEKVIQITREYGEKAIEELQLKLVYAQTAARKAKINRKILTWQRLLIKLAATPVDTLPSECEPPHFPIGKSEQAAKYAMDMWQGKISPKSETEK